MTAVLFDAVAAFIAGIGTRPRSWQGKEGQPPLLFERPRYRPKDEALTYPLISHSNPAMVTGIALDIDTPDARTRWQDRGLPSPNLIIVNPASGRAHYWIQFENAIQRHTKSWLAEKPPSKAWRFYEAVRHAVRIGYGCDPDYSEDMAKNPLHPKWEVIVGRPEPYSLRELYAHPEIRRHMRRQSVSLADDVRGRNSTIFKTGFRWAVRYHRHYSGEAAMKDAIRAEVFAIRDSLAHPEGPLPHAETEGIALSIFRRIRAGKFYKDQGKNRGAACVSPSLDVTTKRKLGQSYSASLKRRRTLNSLIKAHRELCKEGGLTEAGRTSRFSLKLIAVRANVPLSTAYRYVKDVQGIDPEHCEVGECRSQNTSKSSHAKPDCLFPPDLESRFQIIQQWGRSFMSSRPEVPLGSPKLKSNVIPLGHHLSHPMGISDDRPDDPARAQEAIALVQAILRGEITRL